MQQDQNLKKNKAWKLLKWIKFWAKETFSSGITYIVILFLGVLTYFEQYYTIFLMISGGVIASSVFYLILVKIPQVKNQRQILRHTKSMYIYKKKIILTILDKCLLGEKVDINELAEDPHKLTDYLSKYNRAEKIAEKVFIYKEQLLNEINLLFSTLSRFVNLDFTIKNIKLFNITNDYINYLENLTLILTNIERFSEQGDKEHLVKSLTELFCTSTLLSTKGRDFFIEELKIVIN